MMVRYREGTLLIDATPEVSDLFECGFESCICAAAAAT
jgi:hypothetical protein